MKKTILTSFEDLLHKDRGMVPFLRIPKAYTEISIQAPGAAGDYRVTAVGNVVGSLIELSTDLIP